MKNMYRILTVLCVLTFSFNLIFAVPAYRGWQERTLTDGTPVTLRLVGDEFYHFWETKDGKMAYMQADGTFIVTDEERPTATNISKRRAASPYKKRPIRKVGEHNMAPRGLVILVNFKDVSFKSGNTLSAFNDLMNSTN